MSSERRYLDDLAPGQVFDLGKLEVDEHEILDYARRYDPQPFHLDAEAGKAAGVSGLIASGFLTISLAIKLMVEARPFGESPLFGIGVDSVRWPAPVRPGDVLSGSLEVVEVKPSSSKPDRGVVRLRLTLRNARGQVVLSMEPLPVLLKRPAAGSTDLGPQGKM
jgi:acyl dehydratase